MLSGVMTIGAIRGVNDAKIAAMTDATVGENAATIITAITITIVTVIFMAAIWVMVTISRGRKAIVMV